MKDYIRRRGENVSSMEVEKHASSHAQIKEAACIGVKAGEGASSEDEIMIVAVPDGDVSMLAMPISQARGDVELGIVERSADAAASDLTLEDVAPSFSIDVAALTDIARTDDAHLFSPALYVSSLASFIIIGKGYRLKVAAWGVAISLLFIPFWANFLFPLSCMVKGGCI